jgi:hypothetical protein
MGKVKVTTWVDGETAGVLRGLAAQHGVSMSEMCAERLRASVAEHAGEVGVEVLLPALRAAIRREVGGMADRFAHLLARSALESAASRRTVYQLLVRELGAEDARRANEAAWSGSIESLKRPARGLQELLGEFAGDEDGAVDLGVEAGAGTDARADGRHP